MNVRGLVGRHRARNDRQMKVSPLLSLSLALTGAVYGARPDRSLGELYRDKAVGVTTFDSPPIVDTPPLLLVVNTTSDSNDGVCDDEHCSLVEAVETSNAANTFTRITFSSEILPAEISVAAPISAWPGFEIAGPSADLVTIVGPPPAGPDETPQPLFSPVQNFRRVRMGTQIRFSNVSIQTSGDIVGRATGLGRIDMRLYDVRHSLIRPDPEIRVGRWVSRITRSYLQQLQTNGFVSIDSSTLGSASLMWGSGLFETRRS